MSIVAIYFFTICFAFATLIDSDSEVAKEFYDVASTLHHLKDEFWKPEIDFQR